MPDPFAPSTNFYNALVAELHSPATGRLSHHELEELLDSRGRLLLRQLLQDHLDLRALREEQAARTQRPLVVGPDRLARTRLEMGHQRHLATLFGTVTVRRCAWRRPGTANVYPADAALSLPRRRHSYTLARLAVLESVRASFDAATEAVCRRCGPVIGKRQVEDLVVDAAADIDSFYQARIPTPCTADTLLVLSVDGKGVVMRPDALRPATAKAAARPGLFRTRLASGEKPARKRMATLAAVYDAESAPRRPHDVIAPPGGRHGRRRLRPGPHATAKWLYGSVIDDAATVIKTAFDQAEARDPGHRRRWVVLVDGARHQLDLIQTEAAVRRVTIHIVIDFVHVLEYLWGAAWSFHKSGDPAAEDWVAVHALRILSGGARHTAEAIDTQARSSNLTGLQRQGANACIRYLTSKGPFLCYEHALTAGWPIATGVIEGACRHLIADRLDITGARWGLAGAEAILKLRALISNGDLEAYWRFRLAHEHHRLHQGPDRGGYSLAA
ncbi:hypothetical protein DF18_34010 [Streptomyces rimosus]|nr:ISKra4 family transposase [Streptomyces rimosus]KEF16658.1 hypothetical protein DF18_34010 [Streptomyces rimosus]